MARAATLESGVNTTACGRQRMSESASTTSAAAAAGLATDAPPGGPLRIEVQSDPARLADVRRAVEAYAVRAGLGEAAAGDVGLTVNEALANVIRHAYDGRHDRPVVVTADSDPARLTVTIRDWGNGVNPQDLPRPPRDPTTPGGLGLICLRELMDNVAYAPQPDGGMLLTMTKLRK